MKAIPRFIITTCGAILILSLIGTASATYYKSSLQNPQEFGDKIITVGGNFYMDNWEDPHDPKHYYLAPNPDEWGCIANAEGIPNLQYSAISTTCDPHGATPSLYDGNGNLIATLLIMPDYFYPGCYSRSELVINSSGEATVYVDGAIANGTRYVGTNTQYVAWGLCNTPHPWFPLGGGTFMAVYYYNDLDNPVWSDQGSIVADPSIKYVIDAPPYIHERSFYLEDLIYKSFTNPAESGLYKYDGSLLRNTYIRVFFSKPAGNASELVLRNAESKIVYGDSNWVTSPHGVVNFDLISFFADTPPTGRYEFTFTGTGAESDPILYSQGGATLSWVKSQYTPGETATIDYEIGMGETWDTETYSYYINITDQNGAVLSTQDVLFSRVGSIDYAFAANATGGLYTAIIYAHETAVGGLSYGMNIALTNVGTNVTIEGYVNDAETELTIGGAKVNITQNSILHSENTSSYINKGYYSIPDLVTSLPINISVDATGYDNYNYSFTPMYSGQIRINYTLIPVVKNYTGVALAGLDLESAYHNPIPFVNNTIINTTYSEIYSTIGNSVGYYILDESDTVYLTPDRCYNVTGTKVGYRNSINYTKCILGA